MLTGCTEKWPRIIYQNTSYRFDEYYRPIDFLGGEDKQTNDQRRNYFCREHDIRIPYYDYDKITPEYMTELISSCSENKK